MKDGFSSVPGLIRSGIQASVFSLDCAYCQKALGFALTFLAIFVLHYYLPKFTFWQVCSFVGLSVCLSVSLSVLSSITHERFDISSPNLVHIWNG